MEQDRINDIYTELDQADFTLQDYNTPDEIGNAIVYCRGKINQVSNLAVEVQRAIGKIRRHYKGKKQERLIKYNQLLHENEEVKKGKSGLDRQAIAESLLSVLDIEISDLECTLSDLKSLYAAISLRISNLNKTNSDIRLAWNIMSSSVPQVTEALKEPSPISVTEEDFEGFDLTPVIVKTVVEEELVKEELVKEEPVKEEPVKEEKLKEKKIEQQEKKTEEKKEEQQEKPKEEKIEPKEEKKKVKIESKPKPKEESVEEGFEFDENFERDVDSEDIGEPVSLAKEAEPEKEAVGVVVEEPGEAELVEEDSASEVAESEEIEIGDFLDSL
jgi:hypothetical protein